MTSTFGYERVREFRTDSSYQFFCAIGVTVLGAGLIGFIIDGDFVPAVPLLVVQYALIREFIDSRTRKLVLDDRGVALASASKSTFEFDWEEVAWWEWHSDIESPMFEFQFVDERKPVLVSGQSVGDPGDDRFLNELRTFRPELEKQTTIRTFYWKAVSTKAGLRVTGLPDVSFAWDDVLTAIEHSKQPDEREGYIQFDFKFADLPSVRIGDRFVTEPTWGRLMKVVCEHVSVQAARSTDDSSNRTNAPSLEPIPA